MRQPRADKSTLLSYIVLFVICTIIGYFLGVWLLVALFALLSQVCGAIGLLLGTIFALAILLIILFSGTIWSFFKVIGFGLVFGAILSIIINHSLVQSMGGTYTTGVNFWVPVGFIIIVVVFLIIYFIYIRFTIVRRKDIMFGLDKKKRR